MHLWSPVLPFLRFLHASGGKLPQHLRLQRGVAWHCQISALRWSQFQIMLWWSRDWKWHWSSQNWNILEYIEIYWNITLMIIIIIIINAMFSLWLWWSLSLSILNMALLLVAEFQASSQRSGSDVGFQGMMLMLPQQASNKSRKALRGSKSRGRKWQSPSPMAKSKPNGKHTYIYTMCTHLCIEHWS